MLFTIFCQYRAHYHRQYKSILVFHSVPHGGQWFIMVITYGNTYLCTAKYITDAFLIQVMFQF